MTTLAKSEPMSLLSGSLSSIPIIASDIVYGGAMVGDNGAGYGRPLVKGDKFVGHAKEDVDNSSGAAGDLNIELQAGRYRLEVPLVALITDVGQPVYASDDAALGMIGADSAGALTYVGVVTRYVSSTRMEVEFRPGEYDMFGENQNRILKTDDYTLLVTDIGKILYMATKDKTFTLLATVAGAEFTCVYAGGTGVDLELAVDFNAADKNLGGCGMAAGGDGKKLTNTYTGAVRNDYLKVLGDGTDGYSLIGKKGTWAQEA